MPSGFQILIAIAFTVAVIAGIARHDYWKRKNEYTGSIEVKNRYKRTVRRINGVLVTSIILGFVFTFLQPDETVKQTEKVGSESSANLETDNKDTASVDTNLVMGELTTLPEVPVEYTDRYNEVNEVIARTDGLLTLIKKNMSECNGPCSDLPLKEIQTRFDAMEELIATSRNQLQKASEIVNEMAQEDPPELHTQKLFELEENLQATAYSLETMQIADSWESWDEPIEYVENTRTNRLYATPLADTILPINANNQNDVSQTSDEIFQEAEYFKAAGLTIEFGQETMTELSYMSYMCGKVCPDVPGDTWPLQLESMNTEVFALQRSMYQFALELRQIPRGSSNNINFDEIEGLASQMELFADYITPIMTKSDWKSWEEAHAAVDEAILIINEMRVEDVYTLPTLD